MSHIRICFFSLLILTFTSHLSHSCTGFVVAKGDQVWVGNNEDYWIFKTKVWFVPAENDKYGCVYFGFDDMNPQGGMNDRGLFFDGFATDPNPVVKSKDKPNLPMYGNYKVMETCSTVEEVVAWYDKYNLTPFENFMLFYADRNGNSVIIEGDDFVYKKGDYQICTNFYQSNTPIDRIPCWRYKTADSTLSNATTASLDLCRSILDAAHVDMTQYSNVYDLKNGVIYLYHNHDFNHVVKFVLKDELQKGYRALDIPSLFPPNQEFLDRYYNWFNPKTNIILKIFLILCAFLYAVTLFEWPLEWLIRAAESAEKEEPRVSLDPDWVAYFLRVLGTVLSFLLLSYLITLSLNSQAFDHGLPQNIHQLPFLIRCLIQIPFACIVITVCSLPLIFLAWKKPYWTIPIRIMYTLTSFTSIALLFLFYHWELIRSPF